MDKALFMRRWVLGITAFTLSAANSFAHASDKLHECAIVVAKEQTARLTVAATVLSEEVERRTGLGWQIVASEAVRGCAIQLSLVDGRYKPESFSIRATTGRGPYIDLQSSDARGVLFGVGYLLRQFSMQAGSVSLPLGVRALSTSQTPEYAVRGHQLGYRPKNNTFDGWSITQFDRYIRDLAVFGTNTIELIPPRSDDEAISSLYTLPPLEMMKALSTTLDHYGLDCSIWYPALDKDYSDPKTIAFAVQEWGSIFRALPRVDAVFVPGGDPGHTQPKYLFALLEREAAELRKSHPHAQMWVSPQSFSEVWLTEFYGLLSTHPAWLTGVVYGPEMRETPEQFRQHVPPQYAIRFYPDITHTASAQYPVPHWDPAFSLTEGREPVDPRPGDESILFHRYSSVTTGFVAYSEGSNDDVNKVLWSAWGWNPSQSPAKILEQYARYFISPGVSKQFALAVEGLEENWHGRILDNDSIYRELELCEELAGRIGSEVKSNWRVQQILYRATYDAYLLERSRKEKLQEDEALSALIRFAVTDPKRALELAKSAVAEDPKCDDSDLCKRATKLADDLFRSIHMQLSVERYRAQAVDRGADLDMIDAPIGDLPWLRKRLFEADIAPSSDRQSKYLLALLTKLRTPGSIVRDNLGLAGQRPHLLLGSTFEQDPSGLSSAYDGADQYRPSDPEHLAFRTYAGTLYDLPLQMRYTDLLPHRGYQLRVHFPVDGAEYRFRVNGVLVTQHCILAERCNDVEAEIPADLNQDGRVLLEWTAPPGFGGNGRRLKISQVDLVAKP